MVSLLSLIDSRSTFEPKLVFSRSNSDLSVWAVVFYFFQEQFLYVYMGVLLIKWL